MGVAGEPIFNEILWAVLYAQVLEVAGHDGGSAMDRSTTPAVAKVGYVNIIFVMYVTTLRDYLIYHRNNLSLDDFSLAFSADNKVYRYLYFN